MSTSPSLRVIPASLGNGPRWALVIERPFRPSLARSGFALTRCGLNDPQVPETDRLAIIRARRGQGLFRERVSKLETRCRVTGVENPVHLVASHCKPWRDSNNGERLDGENGLLLTPTIDHLFDRGFISFENNGRLLVSPVAHVPSLQKMGIEPSSSLNVGSFTSGQKRFLEFHRSGVFLEAARK